MTTEQDDETFQKNCKHLFETITYHYNSQVTRRFFVGSVEFTTDLQRVLTELYRLDGENDGKMRDPESRLVLYSEDETSIVFVQKLYTRGIDDDLEYRLCKENVASRINLENYTSIVKVNKGARLRDGTELTDPLKIRKLAYTVLQEQNIISDDSDDDDELVFGDDVLGYL
jgi:hypothetical protein